MNALRSIVWFLPFVIVAGGFFTSRITSFRTTRYGIYFGVLFSAFMFDLQSTSFRYDKIDILFYQTVLFVFADFFWRILRNRHLFLRIGALVVGLTLFVWTYHEWVIVGPASLNRLWNAQCLSEYKADKSDYFVKKRCPVKWRDPAACNLILLKTRKLSFLEERIDTFQIPEGYEKSTLSFVWDTSSQLISVQIVGDNDTLWTLGEPLPQ